MLLCLCEPHAAGVRLAAARRPLQAQVRTQAAELLLLPCARGWSQTRRCCCCCLRPAASPGRKLTDALLTLVPLAPLGPAVYAAPMRTRRLFLPLARPVHSFGGEGGVGGFGEAGHMTAAAGGRHVSSLLTGVPVAPCLRGKCSSADRLHANMQPCPASCRLHANLCLCPPVPPLCAPLQARSQQFWHKRTQRRCT